MPARSPRRRAWRGWRSAAWITAWTWASRPTPRARKRCWTRPGCRCCCIPAQPGWRPRFPAYETPARPERAAFATTGLPIHEDGTNASLDVGLAARRALIEMIDHLETVRGFDRRAAYALCSATVDLRISEIVDVPNAAVSALLPLDVFEDAPAA